METHAIEISLEGLIRFDHSVLLNVLQEILKRLKDSDQKVDVMKNSLDVRDREFRELKNEVNTAKKERETLRERVAALETNHEAFEKKHGETAAQLDTVTPVAKEGLNNANEALDKLRKLGSVKSDKSDKSDGGGGIDPSAFADLCGRVVILEKLEMPQANKKVVEAQQKDINKLQDESERLRHDMDMLKGRLDGMDGNQGGLDVSELKALESRMAKLIGELTKANQQKFDDLTLQLQKLRDFVKERGNRDTGKGISDIECNNMMSKIEALRARVSAVESACEQVPENTKAIEELRKLIEELANRPVVVPQPDIDVERFATVEGLRHVNDECCRGIEDVKKTHGKALKTELRRFEKDMMNYLDEVSTSGGGKHQHETNVGRIHFRCIACDQPMQTMTGPSTNAFQSATGAGAHVGCAVPGNHAERASTMTVEKGEELPIFGRDGQVYRGRETSTVQYAVPAPGEDNRGHFTVSYREKQSRFRPQSAQGSRGYRNVVQASQTLPSSTEVWSGDGSPVSDKPKSPAAKRPGTAQRNRAVRT